MDHYFSAVASQYQAAGDDPNLINFQQLCRRLTKADAIARAELVRFQDAAYEKLKHVGTLADSIPYWRRLYTDAALLLVLSDLTAFHVPAQTTALACIEMLDRAIVIAGAADKERLDLTIDLIQKIQSQYLPSRPFVHPSPPKPSPTSRPMSLITSMREIQRLDEPPSLLAFQRHLSKQPFILSGHILDWPAMNEHPWSSMSYLRHVAGPGRVVPVEVGKDYRSDDWSQTFMNWDAFLDALMDNRASGDTLYLAQHNLLMQFPQLRADMIVPDYVYADLFPLADDVGYKPPANDEQLVINAWLGPKGTMSPAHTDPFFNLFAQVVGRKTVWLAPPNLTHSMYPYPSIPSTSPKADHPHHPATNNIDPSMCNTSQIDVFTTVASKSSSERIHQKFWENVVPDAIHATLNPGDILFLPPGWWHAMRSEDVSFSVSMWF